MKRTTHRSIYLTKRLLYSITKKAIAKATENAVNLAGYNVVAINGEVMKKYADGRLEKISSYAQISIHKSELVD
jgi:hypothetical protein